MASAVREKIVTMAKSRQCGLRFDKLTPPVRFAAKDGTTIDFEDGIEDAAFQPLDVLNIENNYAFSDTPIWASYVNHMPHYCSTVFLNVWRITSALTDLTRICESRHRLYDRRYICDKFTPTLLTLVTARKGLKHWYVGAHALLQKAYPSVVALDLSAGDHQRARYVAQECYRSGFVSACVDPKWAAFRSAAQRKLSQAVRVPKARTAVVIGFLTRESSRSLLLIKEAQMFISEQALKLDVPVTFSTFQFEGESFESQSEFMANTDILIAAHGAGLTNVIFMRTGSVLIELIPFGYNQHFEVLALLAGVHYHRLYAHPLPDMVMACLIRRNLTEQGKAWFQEFEQSAAKAKALEGSGGAVPFVNFGISAESLGTVYCLRDQNLTLKRDPIRSLTSSHLTRLRARISPSV
jgi:hypothetical protein